MSLSLLEEIALLPDDEREALLGTLPTEQWATLAGAWELTARPEQLPPPWPWEYWVLCGGRGSGKTRPAAELVNQWALEPQYIALIGETSAEVRDVMVEGPSGLLATARPENPCSYYPSKRRVVWRSGAWGTTFSGDAPDQLRGPNAAKAWIDEMAKFKYPQETWDSLELILRAGDLPQAVISTTPRPLPLLRRLLADTEHNAISRYSTFTNLANLAPSFIARVVRRYVGTRLGRQELYAEMLSETPGALWSHALLEEGRALKAPALQRIVVGLDPGANAGIVVVALGVDGKGYVLEDASMDDVLPMAWARQAVTVYHRYGANAIIAERNHGGDMVETTIRTIDPAVVVRTVWASQGKYARAEPVSALYEQGKVHHVGMLAALEDQLVDWVPGEGMPSPDRMDALVWGLYDLLLARAGPARVLELSF
jgi:phage terminase large subunit-like protein